MSVWIKLEGNEYTNRDPFPQRPSKPILNKDAVPAEIRLYADALEQYDEQLKLYRAEVAAWHAQSALKEAAFRHDLEAEYHMVGHVKADLLYEKAWQMGHSAGLSEVANYYSDLVELVK